MEAILVPILASLFFFGSITLMVKWTLDYFRDKNRIPGDERSLPVSELQMIIEQAVEAGTAPLRERVDLLERRIEQLDGRLEEPSPPPRELPAGESSGPPSATDSA